jgi:hypothetical protein
MLAVASAGWVSGKDWMVICGPKLTLVVWLCQCVLASSCTVVVRLANAAGGQRRVAEWTFDHRIQLIHLGRPGIRITAGILRQRRAGLAPGFELLPAFGAPRHSDTAGILAAAPRVSSWFECPVPGVHSDYCRYSGRQRRGHLPSTSCFLGCSLLASSPER